MRDEPYHPIACGDYDVYEIAIMRGQALELEWFQATGEMVSETVSPLELKIVEGAEYLFFRSIHPASIEATIQRLRLDKIRHARIIDK